MNRKVKRYDPINSDGTCGMCIEDADYGAYVEYADYAALEAELAKLRLVQGVHKQLLEALEHARLFIRNGIEFGYILMPDADMPDTAHDTLPMIEAAIAAARKEGGKV